MPRLLSGDSALTSPVLFCRQQAVGLDHDEGIRCFHGEDEVVEVVLAAREKEDADHVYCGVNIRGKAMTGGGKGENGNKYYLAKSDI